MTRFLLDSGIAGLYLDGTRGVYERAEAEMAKGNRIGIAGPVLSELVFRAEGSPHRDRNILRLRKALVAEWRLWLPTVEVAFEYGRLAFELKRTGRALGQNDITIAAIARSLPNCTVVTMDADFSGVPGLQVENWADPL